MCITRFLHVNLPYRKQITQKIQSRKIREKILTNFWKLKSAWNLKNLWNLAEICETMNEDLSLSSCSLNVGLFWGKVEWLFLSLSQLQKLVSIQFHFVDKYLFSSVIWASFKIFRFSLLHDWNHDVNDSQFLMFSNVFKDTWCMACRYFTDVYFVCKSTILHAIYALVNVAIPMQGYALKKIEGSPVLWTCKIQGTQHMICMKKARAKVGCHRPLGSARAQPCPWPKL